VHFVHTQGQRPKDGRAQIEKGGEEACGYW
jgi:hypothetical protein